MRSLDSDDNASWLRARFAALLLAQHPGSVLDVGCGGGAVLELLADAGVRVGGVENDAGTVEELRARGFVTDVAAAESLPFPSGAFDWVAMRHVPHHLLDERTALREALRVARRGVVVAEPAFERSIPSQRVAEQVDEWLKGMHRRQGRVHRSNLSSRELIDALLAADPDLETEVHVWHRLSGRTLADLEAEARPLLDAVGTPVDRAIYERLVEQARRDGLTWNGSVAVVGRRL